jgi:hypothetical protein
LCERVSEAIKLTLLPLTRCVMTISADGLLGAALGVQLVVQAAV